MTHAQKTPSQRIRPLSTIIAVMAALMLAMVGTLAPVEASGGGNSYAPLFDLPGLAHAHVSAGTKSGGSSGVATVPYWNSFFEYAGSVYSYQMVGTNPANGSATTWVPTVIVPIDLHFANGKQFDGSSKVQSTEDSPLWHSASFSSGYTQYTNALQRAEFWRYTRNENYNVLLAGPSVQSPVDWNVPASDAQSITAHGVTFEEVNFNWWYPKVLGLLSARHISSRVFPIFLTYDVVLYSGKPSNCCIIGYHDAQQLTSNSISTYAWASWTTPGFFSVPIDDVNALSHEVAEWMNDPFTDNIVPPWVSPIAPQYGCNNVLEVGDPLVGVAANVRGYHLQDEAFFSWFSRQKPSIGIYGWYSFFGTFRAPAPVCA